MNKKLFWKHANRGFVFSMVLLAAVLVYVVITQLMLVKERNSTRELADIYCSMMEQTYALTDEQLAQLEDRSEMNKEADRLKSELSKYFVKNSAYIDEAVQPLLDNINRQIVRGERFTKLDKIKSNNEQIMIDQDVAKLSDTFTYAISGKHFNYANDKLEDVNNAELDFHLSISFKKVDGEWKIYRISNVSWGTLAYDHMVRGGQKNG